MAKHLKVRLISLIEDAANSLEQLETLTNRCLSEIAADAVMDIRLESVTREVIDEQDQIMTETDQIMFIRYRDDRSV